MGQHPKGGLRRRRRLASASTDRRGVTIEIRRATDRDVDIVKGVRLAALAAEPDCFGVSLEQEQAMSSADWQRTLTTNAWLIAGGADPVGLVAFFPDDLYPDGHPQLGAMWVHPSGRRGGIARRLETAVTAHARQAAFQGVGLWVTASNAAAVPVYERLGYTLTGASKPAPRDRDVPMLRMAKQLQG